MPKTFEDKATTTLLCALCFCIGYGLNHYFNHKPKIDFDLELKSTVGYNLDQLKEKCSENQCVIAHRITNKDYYFPHGDESSDR